MHFASQAFARIWRRLNAIEKEIASASVVTKETGATEREPVSKPQPRTVAAPPKPPKPPVNKDNMKQWTADRVNHIQPRPTDAEALETF